MNSANGESATPLSGAAYRCRGACGVDCSAAGGHDSVPRVLRYPPDGQQIGDGALYELRIADLKPGQGGAGDNLVQREKTTDSSGDAIRQSPFASPPRYGGRAPYD